MDLEIAYINQLPRDALEDELIGSEHIGLSLIDQHHEELLLICLTTHRFIFLVNPGDKSQVSHFKQLLDHPNLIFYSVDGFWDSDLLNRCVRLNLKGQIDLVSFETYLSLTETQLKSPPPKKTVSVDYILETYKPLLSDHHQLLSKYLKSHVNPNLDTVELRAIQDDALSPSAKIAIRKKSGLARALAIKMREKFYTLRDQDSKDIYAAPLRADNASHEMYQRSDDNSYTTFCKFQTSCPPLPDNL